MSVLHSELWNDFDYIMHTKCHQEFDNVLSQGSAGRKLFSPFIFYGKCWSRSCIIMPRPDKGGTVIICTDIQMMIYCHPRLASHSQSQQESELHPEILGLTFIFVFDLKDRAELLVDKGLTEVESRFYVFRLSASRKPVMAGSGKPVICLLYFT